MKLINNEIEFFSVKISSMIRFNRVLHKNSILSFIAGVNPLVENHTARGSEGARERAKVSKCNAIFRKLCRQCSLTTSAQDFFPEICNEIILFTKQMICRDRF